MYNGLRSREEIQKRAFNDDKPQELSDPYSLLGNSLSNLFNVDLVLIRINGIKCICCSISEHELLFEKKMLQETYLSLH